MSKRSTSSNQLGAEIDFLLNETGTTQLALAEATASTQGWVSQVINGHRRPSPGWLDLVAKAMKLSNSDRTILHRKGAADRGYKIDL